MKIPQFASSRNVFQSSSAVEDAWNQAEIHHLTLVPNQLRNHLCKVIRSSNYPPSLVCLAFVRFGRRSFTVDPKGTLAVIVPILENEVPVNLAAFGYAFASQRSTFRPGHIAVGLEDAKHDARFNAKSRMLVFHSVWEWLRNGGVGLLPVDWKSTAILILKDNYTLLAASETDGARALQALEGGVAFPKMFIRKAAAT
jgi:hypothetical protein